MRRINLFQITSCFIVGISLVSTTASGESCDGQVDDLISGSTGVVALGYNTPVLVNAVDPIVQNYLRMQG